MEASARASAPAVRMEKQITSPTFRRYCANSSCHASVLHLSRKNVCALSSWLWDGLRGHTNTGPRKTKSLASSRQIYKIWGLLLDVAIEGKACVWSPLDCPAPHWGPGTWPVQRFCWTEPSMKLRAKEDSTVPFGGPVAKNLPVWLSMHAHQWRRRRFNPWVGKILWRRKWQSIPVFLSGKSHGKRTLVGYSPWGCKESDKAEQLNDNNNSTILIWGGISILINTCSLEHTVPYLMVIWDVSTTPQYKLWTGSMMYSVFYLLLYPIKGPIPLMSVVLQAIDGAAREKQKGSQNLRPLLCPVMPSWKRNSPGQQVPNMLLEISGEITPERMNGAKAETTRSCGCD